MEKIKFLLSLKFAKFVAFCLKCFKKSATSLPGKLVLQMNPDFLRQINMYLRQKIVAITGTNGKTTTANLIAKILKTNKQKVVSNALGANMLSGVATCLALNCNFKNKNDFFVLESDEAYLTKLYEFLPSDYLVVTNLFRDQLDRYGELDSTLKKIQEAVDKNKNQTILLNADDPIVSQIETKSKNCKIKYFGFETVEAQNKIESPIEIIHCRCKGNLEYSKRFYSHLGHYYCSCGYKRPEVDYLAKAKILKDKTIIELDGKVYQSNLLGTYNAYNILQALAFALELKIEPEILQMALDEYKSVFGRSEKFIVDNKRVTINLIKNPAGATQVLETFSTESANFLIALNDNYADGRDVSWIWDVDFSSLSHCKNKIVVSGTRADDMALRLKYSDVAQENIIIEKNLKNAFRNILHQTKKGQDIIVLPTYTALLKMRTILTSNFKDKRQKSLV